MRNFRIFPPVAIMMVVLAAALPPASALAAGGAVYTWGYNGHGQLGVGASDDTPHPFAAALAGMASFDAISAGDGHTLALADDGTVYAWGTNFNGEIGNGETGLDVPSPLQVPGLSGVTAVAAGSGHSLAVKGNGTVYAWGKNLNGQLGDGTKVDKYDPQPVPGLTGIVAVAAGSGHSLALHENGSVYAWGKNFYGQVGDGGNTDRTDPVVLALTSITDISAGAEHSIARRADSSTFAWGANDNGQLGDLTTVKRNVPTPVFGSFVDVEAGAYHTLGIYRIGVGAAGLKTWGGNYNGQLGQGTTDSLPHHTPTSVPGLHGVAMASGGYDHSLALLEDGTAYGFGRNSSGHLGDGTTVDRNEPVQVRGLSGASQISAGGVFSSAIRSSQLLATVTTTAPAYTTSDEIKILVSLSNPEMASVMDLYLALVMPNGGILFLQLDRATGKVSIHNASLKTEDWVPLVTDLGLPAGYGLTHFPVFTYRFKGSEPAGKYTCYIVATAPGTKNFLGPVGSSTFTYTH